MFIADDKRYDTMVYNRCGKSGLKLPAVSLGLWHNFGFTDKFDNMENMCRTAFNLGITQFDIANNYGSPYFRNFFPARMPDVGNRFFRAVVRPHSQHL